MSEIHNLQIVIHQMPRVAKIDPSAQTANGAQIINVVEKENREKANTKVRQIDEIEQTQKEDPQRREQKKKKNPYLIDLYK